MLLCGLPQTYPLSLPLAGLKIVQKACKELAVSQVHGLDPSVSYPHCHTLTTQATRFDTALDPLSGKAPSQTDQVELVNVISNMYSPAYCLIDPAYCLIDQTLHIDILLGFARDIVI